MLFRAIPINIDTGIPNDYDGDDENDEMPTYLNTFFYSYILDDNNSDDSNMM